MMTEYDFNCIFYLGMQIPAWLGMENKPLLLDEYYEVVQMIYSDYKKYDNEDVGLLTSIDDYISCNEERIKALFLTCIDE